MGGTEYLLEALLVGRTTARRGYRSAMTSGRDYRYEEGPVEGTAGKTASRREYWCSLLPVVPATGSHSYRWSCH